MNRDNLSVVGGNNETLIVNLFIFFYWARWLCALLERLCVQVCACVFNNNDMDTVIDEGNGTEKSLLSIIDVVATIAHLP